tara:strand:- start:78 stop:536 length:459 start_codon:yes stop_codon:yes gene_type:complete
MTKWARMRKRKERIRAESSTNYASEENEAKLTEPEKISDNIKHNQQTQKTETSNSNTILSQVPRYIYLVAIFVLLSGIFFPLITTGADAAFNFAIGGAAILFLGLSGGILLFKAATAKKRGIFLAVGFAFIAISLTLIFLIQEWWKIEFIRG